MIWHTVRPRIPVTALTRRLLTRQAGDVPARAEMLDAAERCAEHDCLAEPPLLAGLRSPHAWLRELCALALGWLGVAASRVELRRLQHDPVPEVRRAARAALQRL